MKIRSVGAELFCADGQTDRQADRRTDGRTGMTKPIDFFKLPT